MSNNNELYFFALLLPFSMAEEVIAIKKHFSEKYESSKALNSPPHITIIPPFFSNDMFEKIMENKVTELVKGTQPFEVKLSGYGHFNKKVMYIDVEKNKSLEDFSNNFSSFFNGHGFEFGNTNRLTHPHVTLAFRDLTQENFEKAWPHFKDNNFSAHFNVMSIHLLKHRDQTWNVVKEFSFS